MVLFVVRSLFGGGAERVMVALVNGLDRGAFAPVLALGAAEGPYLGSLRVDVPLHVLGATRSRRAAPALLRTVRRVRPDVILSTAGLNLAVAAARPAFPRGTRVVLREASSPKAFLDHVARSAPHRASVYRAAYRVLYRQADLVVCQSDAMVCDVADLGVRASKLTRIYNPVDVQEVQRLAGEPLTESWTGSPRLVSVGRLAYEKGYDTLIESMVAVRERHPGATLRILGDGGERGALEEDARRLGLATAVRLSGFSANPYPTISSADLFVSPSRYEGFSNAIIEALACGVPVVATDCPSANREVIEEGVNGWLAGPPGDPAALAASINRALDERAALRSQTIRRRCGERFSATRALAAYERVLKP